MAASSQRFSFRFWFEKLVLILIIPVLFWASWWLWDYSPADTLADSTVPSSANTAQQTTIAPTAATNQAQPVESPTAPASTAFPFTFDGKSAAADFPGIDAEYTEFSYAFDTSATVDVFREGSADQDSLSRDFVWEYTVSDTGEVQLSSTPVIFCTEGANCGLGNGILEVIVVPAAGVDMAVVFYIQDSGDVTEFTAVTKYTPLIQSYKEL